MRLPSPAPSLALPLATSAVALALATGLAAAVAFTPSSPPPPLDPCALPAGLELAALPDSDRSMIARHALACSDLEHGRISAAQFRERLAAPAPIAVLEPAPTVWASEVRSFSSQYAESSWSAAQALGAPNVFPGSGDHVNAWASLEADGKREHLELGFGEPRRISGVEILETYNPGAISRVELVLADGRTQTVLSTPAAPIAAPAHARRIDFACTSAPVAGVRITIDSAAVPGWNEIDAVGVTPCR